MLSSGNQCTTSCPSLDHDLLMHCCGTRVCLCIREELFNVLPNSIHSSMDTLDRRILACGLILVFTSNSEQLCFVGLFLYRLGNRCTWFKFTSFFIDSQIH